MFDVDNVTSLDNDIVDINKVMTFIGTQMLLAGWSVNDNAQNQLLYRPFIMLVGSSHDDGQRCPTLVNQNMDLSAGITLII